MIKLFVIGTVAWDMVLFNEGIGEGTITKIPNDFGVYVKWDRVDSEIYYNQEYLPVYICQAG